MNFSTNSSENYNRTSNNNYNFFRDISKSQFIGIIVAAVAFLISFGVLLFLIIYQKYRLRTKILNNGGLTSNNPCYVGSSINQIDANVGHAHCNMSVSTDFYDIDDLTSLDNDSFLNSLENAIFVGYLNHSRPSINLSDNFSQSIVHSNQQVPVSKVPMSKVSNTNTTRHSYKKSAPSRCSTSNSSIKLRTGKTKRSVNNTNGTQDRIKSEAISESTGSTSNLITSSKMFIDDSIDSVCDSSKDSRQFSEALADRSCETNIDLKAESSTDSHTSVNSTSAMMSAYKGDKRVSSHGLPDLINSSVPKTSNALKRASSAYSNTINREDSSMSGQILDPLRAGKNIHFINDIARSSTSHGKHERHFSYNVALSNSTLFEYNVSS